MKIKIKEFFFDSGSLKIKWWQWLIRMIVVMVLTAILK
jgi:hypothetical protein